MSLAFIRKQGMRDVMLTNKKFLDMYLLGFISPFFINVGTQVCRFLVFFWLRLNYKVIDKNTANSHVFQKREMLSFVFTNKNQVLLLVFMKKYWVSLYQGPVLKVNMLKINTNFLYDKFMSSRGGGFDIRQTCKPILGCMRVTFDHGRTSTCTRKYISNNALSCTLNNRSIMH